jgi:glycosyltransferase involved in cell wall biosynthesis
MNLTLLLPDLRGGGAERVTMELGYALVDLGHRVDLLLLREEGDYLTEARDNFPVHSLHSPRVRHAFRPLLNHLRDHRPDGLIAMMWPLTVLAPLAARLASRRTKVAVVEHGILSHTYADRSSLHGTVLRASLRLGYRLADARIGVSAGVAADMARMAALPKARVGYAYNPIPLPAPLDPLAVAKADALWHGSGPRILTVGNLKREKNHALLLRAFAQMSNPSARLMILGRGQCEADLRTLAADLGVADRLLLPGFQDPGAFYATADLFALSSDSEGFGNVLVEAMAHGLRIVSTDCPTGPSEVLGKGRWGRLVPVGDASALAQGMEAALASPVDPATQKARAGDFVPSIAAQRYLSLMGLA